MRSSTLAPGCRRSAPSSGRFVVTRGGEQPPVGAVAIPRGFVNSVISGRRGVAQQSAFADHFSVFFAQLPEQAFLRFALPVILGPERGTTPRDEGSRRALENRVRAVWWPHQTQEGIGMRSTCEDGTWLSPRGGRDRIDRVATEKGVDR